MEEPQNDTVTLVEVGRPGLPGCLTVTAIDASGDDAATVDRLAEQIIATLVDQPGYLGTLFATADDRHFTVTAWGSVDDVEMLHSTAHGAAMRAHFSDGVGTRVMTSVWVPHRVNDVLLRPPAGGRPEKAEPAETVWL